MRAPSGMPPITGQTTHPAAYRALMAIRPRLSLRTFLWIVLSLAIFTLMAVGAALLLTA